MNRQVNYIIQGFLLALLIPVSGFIAGKINSTESKKQSTAVNIDYAETSKPDALTVEAAKGKMIFIQKCAACHHVFKDGTGPALMGFEERGPWANREKLYAWIRNPSAFMKKDSYTTTLKKKYSSIMTAFTDITNEEIDNIAAYINHSANQ